MRYFQEVSERTWAEDAGQGELWDVTHLEKISRCGMEGQQWRRRDSRSGILLDWWLGVGGGKHKGGGLTEAGNLVA
jgi:hypothetical protein